MFLSLRIARPLPLNVSVPVPVPDAFSSFISGTDTCGEHVHRGEATFRKKTTDLMAGAAVFGLVYEATLMRAAWCSALLLAAETGCALVTNLDTNGYRGLDAGSARDAACEADACLDFQCLGVSDCPSGWICCLDVSSPPSVSFSCKMGSVCGGSLPVQLCRTDGECGGGGGVSAVDGGPACTHQRCTLGGGAFEFEACGNLPGCSM